MSELIRETRARCADVDGGLVRFVINEQDRAASQDGLAGALEKGGQAAQTVRILFHHRDYAGPIVPKQVRSVEGAIYEVLIRLGEPSPTFTLLGVSADQDLIQSRLRLTSQTVGYAGQDNEKAIPSVGRLSDHRHETRGLPTLHVTEDQAASFDLLSTGPGEKRDYPVGPVVH